MWSRMLSGSQIVSMMISGNSHRFTHYLSDDIEHILIFGSANSHSYFVSRFRVQQCRVGQPVGALELGFEEMEREWGNQEEMEREWGNGKRFTLYISSFSLYFRPPYSFPICRKMLNMVLLLRMSQKKHTYMLWGYNSGSNSLRGSSASFAGLQLCLLTFGLFCLQKKK